MYLLLSQRHIFRIIRLPALFGLNPLELSKEAPSGSLFPLGMLLSHSYLLKGTFLD